MLSLSFVVYLFRRERAFMWSPAVDLLDMELWSVLAPQWRKHRAGSAA